MECSCQTFVEVGLNAFDGADDSDMRYSYQWQSVRDGLGRSSQSISSSAPPSAGIKGDCDVSVHLEDANCADGEDSGVPYQAGNGYIIRKFHHSTIQVCLD